MYIPFALKLSHPEVYGHYLAKKNAFLESHRNIAIVGVHPIAMDYGDPDSPDENFPQSLWKTLFKLDGVYRVDSCRRTFDLGKWNISCNSSHYQDITHWIDTHLTEIWSKLPVEMPSFEEFSTPERLSRNRVARSVASGLTDASPVSHYLKSLAARNTQTKIASVVRNPWRPAPPVTSVQYLFDKADYPPLDGNPPTASTAVSTMPDASGVSACSLSQLEGHATSVRREVDQKLLDLNQARKLRDDDFTSRMNAIEDSIQKIKEDLDAIADVVTDRVLIGLQKPNGLLFRQDAKIDAITAQLLKLLPMVEAAIGIPPTGPRPLSRPTSDI